VPVWAWIIVTVVTGVGSGLIGTLVKVRHERGADLRRRSLEVVEEVAARCDDWFQAVQTAIDARWEGMQETDESDAAFKAAEEAIAQARRDVNRMHAVLPRKSRTALHARGMLGCLSEALEPLRDWPPDPDEVEDAAELDADWSGDEDDDYHPVFTPMSEEIDEARMWRSFGLQEFGRFIEVAPTELRGGFWPAVARCASRRRARARSAARCAADRTSDVNGNS
jgi:hypothetical protein